MNQVNRDGAARLAVFSTLFPHGGQPQAGLFIRERMFRVGKKIPLVVVAPVPWFPLQGLIRLWRPHFRPSAPFYEVKDGFEVYRPRFFSPPAVGKSLDGLFMALGALPVLWRLQRAFRFNILDAHFAYPEGYAATLLGRWLKTPVTITLRGTEVPLARSRLRRRLMVKAVNRAARVFAVADSLRRHLAHLGADENKITVVGNGVDTEKFQPLEKLAVRRRLDIPADSPVLITVGGLVERKGFHRVIECLPSLRKKFPDLRYLIVGGACAEGDWSERLRQQVRELGLEEAVYFLGALPSEELKVPLSAADLFVLASGNEGWANVILEAMACGLPVVATEVGGNSEVICAPELGIIVPLQDKGALEEALAHGLEKRWDRSKIIAYARQNSWDGRVARLIRFFNEILISN